ncbi:TRDC protein, partial [Neopipo cinnamomea]|nr:TRDC protein [Neopipo cinnamomea]
MKSKKLEEGDSPGKAACLARNFSTGNISLEMSSAEVVYEQSTAILTSQGFYSAMKVVNVTKDTEVTCQAHFDVGTMTALPEKEAEEPVTRTSNKVCNSTDTSAQGTTVQRVNMLSMAVLALRVLLAKSIAFNTLMSIKLVLF